MIARLMAPYASISGKTTSPDTQDTTSAVVNMPDKFGRTLVRGFITPTQPNSTPQVTARSRFTTVSEAYQTLSVEEVEGWQALADTINRSGRLGLDYRLNWTQLFQSTNNYRLQNGASLETTPPSTILSAPVPTAITQVSTDDETPDQAVIITVTEAAAPGTDSYLAIRLTRDLGSPNRKARTTDFRYIATPAASILGRDNTSPYTYAITSTVLNVFSTTYVGVDIIVLNSDYIPIGRITNTNILVVAA